MRKILMRALSEHQEHGVVSGATVRAAQEYDRKHPMWACMADDEMRSGWEAVKAAPL